MKLLTCWILNVSLALASIDLSAKPEVVFVSPEPGTSSFWRNYENIMQEAARQLEVDLEIIHANTEDRFGHISAIEQVVSADPKPDYVVSIFKKNHTVRMLELLQQNDILFFATSSDVDASIRQQVGTPGVRYQNWIGHFLQDNVHAGQLLMQTMFEKSGGKPGSVVGLSGSRDSTVAFQRNEGLTLAASQNPLLKLEHIFFTNWDHKQATDKLATVRKRFPDTRYLWCASDEIAAGVISGLTSENRANFVVGSIDWTRQGIEMYRRGETAAAIGGHFAEGALIIALLKDHSEGKDFSEQLGKQIPFRMGLYSGNEPLVNEVIVTEAWHMLDFTLLRQDETGQYPVWTGDYGGTLQNLMPAPEHPK